MGQKVHPTGLRLGTVKTWNSKWFANRQNYADFLHEDLEIRRLIKKRLHHAGISKIEIERFTQRIRVNIHTARPGIIIGRKGQEVEKLKKFPGNRTGKQVLLNIREIKTAELDSQLVAESIAQQLERRVSFRRAMKRAESAALQAGAQGIKIMCAGRLGGAEMSRTEWYRSGRIPLHTIRADIDYGFAVGRTTYGTIGVKVWIFKGEVVGAMKPAADEE